MTSIPNIYVNGEKLEPTETITYKEGKEVSRVSHVAAQETPNLSAVNLDAKIREAFDIQEQMKTMKERLEHLKDSILHELEDSSMNATTLPLDSAYDIAVKISERTTKKLDKEEMALALGVAESSIDTKFLLKAAEDRKLTLNQYMQFINDETNIGISIRRVKGSGAVKPEGGNQ